MSGGRGVETARLGGGLSPTPRGPGRHLELTGATMRCQMVDAIIKPPEKGSTGGQQAACA